MNRGLKIGLAIVLVGGLGYAVYHFAFKKDADVENKNSAGQATDEDLIYDKKTRIISIIPEQ